MKTPSECPEPCCLNAALRPRRTLFEVIARWWPLELLVLVGLPVTMWSLAAVISYRMPTRYESSTLIEITPPPTPLEPGQQAPADSRLTPEFLTTQAEIMKAGDSLQKVITNLDLAKQWNLEVGPGLVNKLKRQVTVTVLPKTHLIRITARDPNPSDARDIAAEIGRAYREVRLQGGQSANQRQVEELKKAIRSQEDTVEACRKVLFAIVKAKQIVVADGTGESGLPDDRGLGALSVKQAELELSKATLDGHLKGLEKNPYEQLLAYNKTASPPRDAIATAYFRYVETQRLLENLKTAEPPADAATKKDSLEGDLGMFRNQLDECVTVLKGTLRGELELATAKLDAIRSHTAAITKDLIENAGSRSDYLDANTTFQRETDQLQRMKRQRTEWEIRLGTPWEPAIVREEPMVAERPASPNVRRNLRRATVGGLLVAVLVMVPFALLFEGFSSNRRMKKAAAATPPSAGS